MKDVARSLRPTMHTAKRSFDAQDVSCPQAINERIREGVDPFAILKAPPGEAEYQVSPPSETQHVPQRSSDPGNHLRNATNIDTVMVRPSKLAAIRENRFQHWNPDEAPKRNAEDANVVQVGLPLFLDDGIYPIIHVLRQDVPSWLLMRKSRASRSIVIVSGV
jgi:hypothetical protein